MSLRWKFFLSFLTVAALTLLTLSLAMTLVAPADFSDRVRMMADMRQEAADATPAPGEANNPSTGMIRRPGVLDRLRDRMISLEEVQAELNANFRQSVRRALLLAGLVAVVAAGVASFLISQRIVKPIAALGRASQRIAGGHYEERLIATEDDELGDLTHSFNAMAGALAETEAMRQQLIADVSHELKTPLSSIKGYMEGLQDGVIAPTEETFQLVHDEAERLQRLVHDLQELSRAEADQIPLHLGVHDAAELAASAAEWLRPQFADHGIALAVSLPEGALRVRADFDRARQVLLNLLGNALQYTPEGGQVTLTVTAERDAARFSVADTGVGLAGEDLQRVFQRFYRVDKSRARASGGSGIGLTIARHLAEAHGGRLWAESAGPGRGSTFHFTLPLAG